MKFDFDFAVLITAGIPLIAFLIALTISYPKEALVGIAVVAAFAVVFIIAGLIGGRLY